MARFKSVTPDIGQETANYKTAHEFPRKWWEIHRYNIAELAALVTVSSFIISVLDRSTKFFRR